MITGSDSLGHLVITIGEPAWAEVAEEDLKNIILYIADDSPTNARAIFEKIKD